MKQSQNGRRGRSRSNARKSGKSQDPNRVEIKVRGNPKQLLEKYKNAARDAMQAGDRVLAEHNLQFADHYQRVLNEMRGLTKGLFSGDYVVVERAERPAEAEEDEASENTEADGDAATAEAEGSQQRERRPRRGRRGNPNRQEHREENAAPEASKAEQAAEPATAEADSGVQPIEVHPELDLAAGGEQAEAPKPRRRGRPRRTAAPAAEAPTQAEGEVA